MCGHRTGRVLAEEGSSQGSAAAAITSLPLLHPSSSSPSVGEPRRNRYLSRWSNGIYNSLTGTFEPTMGVPVSSSRTGDLPCTEYDVAFVVDDDRHSTSSTSSWMSIPSLPSSLYHSQPFADTEEVQRAFGKLMLEPTKDNFQIISLKKDRHKETTSLSLSSSSLPSS